MTTIAPTTAPVPPAPGSTTAPTNPGGFNNPTVPTAGTTVGGGAPGKTSAGGSCEAPGKTPVQQTPIQGGGGVLAGGNELSGVLTQLTDTITKLTQALSGMAGSNVAGATGGGAAAPAPAQKAPETPAQQTPPPASNVAGATGGGAAPAKEGAAQVQGGGGLNSPAIVQALQAVVQAITQLIQALTAQVGGAMGGGSPAQTPPGKVGGENGAPTQVPPGKVGGDKGGPVQQAPVQKAPTQVGGANSCPPPAKPAPAPAPKAPEQKPPTQVGGDKGGPVQQAPAPKAPEQKPPTQVGGDKGGPVQQAPIQVPPTLVGGANGSPAQKTPVQTPIQSPIQSPVQVGGGGEVGDVTLNDEDKRHSVVLKSGAGNSVELWGDPHVVFNFDGKEEKFDIGYGPGLITLQDGTKINWDTVEKTKMMQTFNVDRPGTAGDQGVDTRDGVNSKDLQTFMTDAQLREFATALRQYKGDALKPLTIAGGGPEQKK